MTVGTSSELIAPFGSALGLTGGLVFCTRLHGQWHVILLAAILCICFFTQRHEWVFPIEMAALIFIYVRNIMLLHVEDPENVQAP